MELLDVYDDNGNVTGKIVERRKNLVLEEGEHIAVAIIYIENSNGEYLIQKIAKQKGGMYSSTGGHVNHNEKPIDTIKREVFEELDIDISNDDIVDLGYTVFDFPVRFLFYLNKDFNLSDIVLQEDEVESASFISLDQLKNIIDKRKMHKAHALVFEKVLEYKKDNNYRKKAF